MNLATHLQRMARAYAQRPAVALGESVVYSYARLAERTARLAAALRGTLGLGTGDRVAIVMANHPSYLEALYACWHAGLVAVPINAKLHANEVAFILDQAQARVAIATTKQAAAIASATPATLAEIIDVDGDRYAALLQSSPMAMVPRAADSAAWLFYTSGTTGRPKGAVLTHRNLFAMTASYLTDVDPDPPWSAILHAAPMSHGSGLYALPHILKGSCHVIPESGGFEADEIFALIRCWPGCVFFAAPTMVRRLTGHSADADTANLKTIIYGGGPMYLNDCLQALDRFGPKLSQLYGQGESPMTITALNAAFHADSDHPRWRQRLASVGIAQSAVEVAIDVPADAPPGTAGEVLVRGDAVMQGYWRNPEATAETLRDGWLHTGDFGSMDAEGFLTLKDRSKDLIISGGTNIYPREVEEVLLSHDAVAEVSVIGRPDAEWGESVVAYIVAAAGIPTDEALADALDRHCIAHIARFKRPKQYRWVAALPKNNYGKVLKTRLREIEQAAPPDRHAQITAD